MLTQPEKEYVKRLLQAQPSLTNEDLDTLIAKRRENESQGKSNRAPQKGILGAIEGFNQFVNTNPIASTARDVGAGAIQAGGEVSAGLLGQLSRLAPGNQSADQSSFYNQTQRLLGNTKKDMQSEGINTEGLAYGAGKGIMNIAAGSVGAGLLGKGISAAAKTKMLSNLGIKVAQASPTAAKYGSNIVQGLAGGANKGNLVQRTLGGIATGAREGLGFDLATGNAPGAGMKTGAVIGGAAPIVGALASVAGKGIKKGGEALYKTAIRPNVDEAGKIIQSKAKGLAMPTTRADTALKYGVQGTEKSIGIQGVKKADKIFKETINPAIERSKATHKIDDIFSEVEKKIAETRSVTRKQELIDGLNAWKEEFATTGKKIFNTGDLQAEKSALDKFTQSKIFKGKEVADGYNQVKNILANVMRQRVRDDLGKTGIKNAKELYKEWANLMELESIGIKGITEGGKRGGSGTAIMTILDKYLTPVKTIGGNTLYRVGKGIEFTGPKGIKTLGEFLSKGGYKVIGDLITKE